MLSQIRERVTRHEQWRGELAGLDPEQFSYQLALLSPLKHGEESDAVADALGHDAIKAERLAALVNFSPRNTYPRRALAWARRHGGDHGRDDAV